MLSQSEIDALLGATGPEEAVEFDDELPSSLAAVGRAVKTYDFRRPDKFSKDQLRTLQSIHENIGRQAGNRLSSRLRTLVTLQLADAEQMIYDELLAQLTIPTQLIVGRSASLDGPILVDFDLGLAFAAVDRMLGGAGNVPAVRRDPTGIENELIVRMAEDIIAAIGDGWSHLQPLDLGIEQTALRPSLLRVAAPTHVMAVLTYEVRIGACAAPVRIAYPYSTLESLIPRLSATAWYSNAEKQHESIDTAGDLEAEIQLVEIGLSARLSEVEVPVESLADLKPGDVIRFDQRFDAPVRLTVMNVAQAWAIPGRINDRLALRLVSPLQALEA